MFADRIFRSLNQVIRQSAARVAQRSRSGNAISCESLETRTLLSVSASAQLILTSTTGSQASPVYHYSITVHNTGTTNIGTFWFGWLPGEDFLPNAPLSESNPTGWSSAVTGSDDNFDGSAIEWTTSSNPIASGSSLTTFGFTSPDSPTALAAKSPDYPQTDAMLSTVYSGLPFSDAGFNFTVTPAVTTAASTTTVVADHPSINVGDAVQFTATVAPGNGSGPDPTGTVTFLENGNSMGTAPVTNGVATLSSSTLAVGSLSITAQYGGDSNYSSSTSAAITEIVATGTAPSQVALTTSAASVGTGTAVTFTAVVAPNPPPGAIPTGIVTFFQNGTSLGPVNLLPDGTAPLMTSALPAGTDNITASYSGDGTFAPSTSNTVIETVTAPSTLTPTIVKSTLPTAVVAGAAAHGAVTLSINNTTGAPVKGKITLQLFASTTGVIDGSSIQLANVVRNLGIKTTKTTGLPVKIAAGALPAGNYMLLARVVDLNAVNNDSVAGPTLTAAAPFIALSETFAKMTIPASVVAGAKAHSVAVLRITNNGNIITPPSTTAALFASLTGVVDGSATQIASVTKPLKIKPGKTVSLAIPVKLIPAIAAGAYTIVAQVTDPNGGVTSVTSSVVNVTTG